MTRTKTRALANWPNNTVSVLDFGAFGDGITDDSAAIQAAVDYLEAQMGGGTIYFPNGSYVVRTQVYTEAFNSNVDVKRYGITLSGESTLQTKILLQNHDGFFEWNQSYTWRSTQQKAAANINFEARNFTVVLEAHVLEDQLPDGMGINYSCGQVFRIIGGGSGSNTHWQNVTFDRVDIQNYATFETNPHQEEISNTGPTGRQARTGNYARIGAFLRGTNRNTFLNCNWSPSAYGSRVGKNQYHRPDAFNGESLSCSINTSNNIISCPNHGFNIGDPIIFQGNGDKVTYELVYPNTYPNVKSQLTVTDDKLTYFVSPINYTKDQFCISNSYACLTETQAGAIADKNYPNEDPNYCPAIDLVRLNFNDVGIVSCKVIPATCCVYGYDSYGIMTNMSAFWGLRFGYRQESTREAGSEGGTLRDSNFSSDTGVFVYSPGIEPGFTIRNSHFNNVTNGVRLINRKSFAISDNMWYNVTDKDTYSDAYEDIKLENCNESSVKNINFWWGSRTNRVNVYADSDCYNITVKDCQAVCVDGILFKVEPGSTGNRGVNNIVNSGDVYPVGRVYSGDIAVIHPTNAGAMVGRDGNRTVNGDGVARTLPFNATIYDNFGGGISNVSDHGVAGGLVIPPNQGINYVKFNASIVTSNDAENVKIFIKAFTGNARYGLTGTISNGDSFGNLVCHTASGIVKVDTSNEFGNVFVVEVTHGGGSELSILPNAATFFSYEVING